MLRVEHFAFIYAMEKLNLNYLMIEIMCIMKQYILTAKKAIKLTKIQNLSQLVSAMGCLQEK